MGCDVNRMFELLRDDNSYDLQKQGLNMARKIDFLSILFQPSEDQSVWDNCALVLCEKSDNDLIHYRYEMLKWLQDANWPGFIRIFSRLKAMDATQLVHSYVNTVKEAKVLGEDNWLDYLAGLIENRELYNLLPQDIQILMDSHYKNFWG